jgi:DNA-binding transcriptional LysR family regulator
MDLRQMRQFVAVAEELHFRNAAKRLNMEQAPLSQSIKRLEQELGVQLFDRSQRSVALTDPGRVFFEEARRMLMQAELMRKLTLREAVKTPEIRMSFIGPALYRVLPDMLVRYRSIAPEVHIRLLEHPSPEQMRGLQAGDYDIGFVTVFGTDQGNGCETLLIERTPFVAAIPAGWPLGENGGISLAELAEQPFIQPPQQYAAQLLQTRSMFKQAGTMPHVVQEATQTNTSLSLVAAGLGCSLVMATAQLLQPRNVRFLRILDNVPSPPCWELMMSWHAGHLSKRAASFVEFAKTYMAENPQLLDPLAPIIG